MSFSAYPSRRDGSRAPDDDNGVGEIQLNVDHLGEVSTGLDMVVLPNGVLPFRQKICSALMTSGLRSLETIDTIWIKNQRSLFVSRTRPRTLRRK